MPSGFFLSLSTRLFALGSIYDGSFVKDLPHSVGLDYQNWVDFGFRLKEINVRLFAAVITFIWQMLGSFTYRGNP